MINARMILSMSMLVAFAIFSPSSASPISAASAGTQKAGHATFALGHVTVLGQPGGVKTEAFICTPARFKKGEKLEAAVSNVETWSMESYSVKVGNQQISYPIIGMVIHDGGKVDWLVAATVTFKRPVRAGKMYNSGGWSIIASHAAGAGEAVPVVMIDQRVILSVGPVPGVEHGENASVPWLRISKAGVGSKERTAAEGEWRKMLTYAGLNGRR